MKVAILLRAHVACNVCQYKIFADATITHDSLASSDQRALNADDHHRQLVQKVTDQFKNWEWVENSDGLPVCRRCTAKQRDPR
jgi:hypothetical protein